MKELADSYRPRRLRRTRRLDDYVTDRGGGAWGLLCGCGPCGRGISVVQFSTNSIDVDSCDTDSTVAETGLVCVHDA